MFLADEFLAKSEPLNVSESDELSLKFEHETKPNIKAQAEINIQSFFILSPPKRPSEGVHITTV